MAGWRTGIGDVSEPRRKQLVSRLGAVAALGGAAAIVGTLVGFGNHPGLVFAIVVFVGALPLFNVRPVIWIALAIALPWTSRLLTTTGLAPRFLDFVDFPLVLVALVVCGVRFLGSDRRLPQWQAKIYRRVAVAAVVIALSWGFNDLQEPARLIASWVLALEPFFFLLAVLVTPLTLRERRFLILLTAGLLSAQLLFSSVEILVGSRGDLVKGTLLEAGAGHHVSAGGLSLGFFLLFGLRLRKSVLTIYGVGALSVIVIADAKQVLFLLPLALLVLGVSGVRRMTAASLVGGILAGAVMAGASGYAIMSYSASSGAFNYADKSVSNDTGKIAVAKAIWSDLNQSAPTLLFGLGPGESVSRFSFLTTPRLYKAGSPVGLLGLHSSRGADHYAQVAASGPYNGGNSSFNSADSSMLGMLGDYGLAGGAAFCTLILSIFGALRRTTDRGLRSAALASWTLLLPLALIFDWLEQPPFTLTVMIITGLACRDLPSMDATSTGTESITTSFSSGDHRY